MATHSKGPKTQDAFLDMTERKIRVELTNLLDDVYVAFKASGRSDEEYLIVQFYESILFKAVNDPSLSQLYRLGGLKLIRLYLRGLKEAYTHGDTIRVLGENHAKKR